MLPISVLRRVDCIFTPTKPKVLPEHERRKDRLKATPTTPKSIGSATSKCFSANVRRIFEDLEFENEKTREANILNLVVSKFCDVDLHPKAVPNEEMARIFENLIRRFNELANETADNSRTAREVIRLMVNILFINDGSLLAVLKALVVPLFPSPMLRFTWCR